MNWLNSISKRALGLTDNRSQSIVETRAAQRSAPQGALSSLQWHSPGQPVYSDYSDEDALHTVQRRSIYAYKCISTIANSLAGCPFRAGDPISYNFDLGAPLASLLGPAPGSPNPMMSANALWRYSIAQYLSIGKFAWMKEYDNFGNVIGLWPLQAQHLLPRPARRNAKGFTNGLSYFENFRYGTPGSPGYVDVVKLEDVVYIYNQDWGNPLKPQSPLQAAGITINIHTLIDMFDYALMKNGGTPSGLMVTPPFANTDDRNAFRQQFQAEFGGAANAGKVMFGERDFEPGEEGSEPPDSVKWIPTATSPRDAQLSILRDQKVRDICVSFGVPLSLLMDSTLSKFQNSPTDRRNYWLETCAPLGHDLEDKVNIQLARQLGPQTGWFDLSSVPELAKVPTLPDGTQAVALEAAGAFTWTEWRAERGLPPLPQVNPDPDSIVEGEPAVTLPNTAPALPSARTSTMDKRATVAELTNIEIHTRWICQPGACDECLAYDGRVDAVSDNPEYPSSVHPNCRCAKEYFIEHRAELPRAAFIRRDQHSETRSVSHESMMVRQLGLLFGDQAKSTQDRLNGRRVRSTSPQVADVFDQTYWEQRTYEYLSIFNAPEVELRNFSREITQETMMQLSGVLALPTEEVPTAMTDCFILGPERALIRLSTVLKEALAS